MDTSLVGISIPDGGLHDPWPTAPQLRKMVNDITELMLASGLSYYDANAIFEGDSITAGLGLSVGEDWPSQLMALSFLNGRATKHNVAVSGSWISAHPTDSSLNIADRYAANVYPLRPAVTGKPAYLFLFIGINEIHGSGDNAATIFGRWEDYVDTALDDGFTVFACTITPNDADSQELQDVRDEYNRLIVESRKYHRLLRCADVLSDASSLDDFQEGPGAGLHPTASGDARLAVYMNDVLLQGGAPPVHDPLVRTRKSSQRFGRVSIGTDHIANTQLSIKTIAGDAAFRIRPIVSGSQVFGGFFNDTGNLEIGVANAVPTIPFANSLANASFIVSTTPTALQFGTDGDIDITLLPNGFTGFGTTNPLANVDIRGGGNALLLKAPTSTGGVFAQIQTGNGNGLTLIGAESSAAGTIFATSLSYASFFGSGASGSDVQLIAAGVSAMVIKGSNRFVGVGNTNPGALFDVGLAGTTKGVIRLAGNTSGNVIIQPAAVAGTWSLTLPVDDGAANQVLLNGGGGVTSWSSVTFAMLSSGAWDDDVALAANSATKLATQHAIKSYVDNLVAGLKFKQDCRVASTANVSISSAPAAIDGVTLSNGDRVLLKNQTSASENGAYIFNGASSALTRATDADSGAEMISATFPIREGTANADTWWTVTNDSITLGSTSIVFTQTAGAGTYTAGSGLSLSGNAFSIAAGGVTNAMLAGSIAASKLVGTDIATVGTITSGTWQGATVGVAYGGTGLATLTANAIYKGNGTSALAVSLITDNGSKVTITHNGETFRLAGSNDTGGVYMQINTSAGSGIAYLGVESNAGGAIVAGTAAYAAVYGGSGTVQFVASGAVKMALTSGLIIGSPTGGDKGNGSINAVTVWRNGTALDFVFEPGYKLKSIDEMQRYFQRKNHLPTIQTRKVHQDGSTNEGALTDALWETAEVHAIYIAQLHKRIKQLEAQVRG